MDLSCVIEEDVCRFDIPVAKTCLVGYIEGFRYLDRNPYCFSYRQPALL